jgi:hypothetical protein
VLLLVSKFLDFYDFFGEDLAREDDRRWWMCGCDYSSIALFSLSIDVQLDFELISISISIIIYFYFFSLIFILCLNGFCGLVMEVLGSYLVMEDEEDLVICSCNYQ